MGREELLRAFAHKGFRSAESKLRVGARLSHSEAQMLYQFVQITKRALGNQEELSKMRLQETALGGMGVDEIDQTIAHAFFAEPTGAAAVFYIDSATFLELFLVQRPPDDQDSNPFLNLYCFQIVCEGSWGISWAVGNSVGIANMVVGFVDNKEGLRAKATGMKKVAEAVNDQLWAAGADLKAKAAAIEDQGVGLLLEEDERDKEGGEAAPLQQGALYDEPVKPD